MRYLALKHTPQKKEAKKILFWLSGLDFSFGAFGLRSFWEVGGRIEVFTR